MLRAGARRRPARELLAVLVPVLAEPVHLLVTEAEGELRVVQPGVLREGGELGCDVDPQPGGLHGERPVVEEPVDVAAQYEPAVLEVRAQLGVAVQVARLEDARRCPAGERAPAALGREEPLPELTLAPEIGRASCSERV